MTSELLNHIHSSVHNMTTIQVDNVKTAANPLPVAESMLDTVKTKIQVTPESCCKLPVNQNPIKSRFSLNSFVEAVHRAYTDHYPLVLSPDIIWQCVAQGFAIHVNKNAEKLRHMFVVHEGKKTIEAQMDSFVKGSPDNDWEEALGVFSEEIRKNIGDEMHDLLTPDFTTTGPVEKAASQVVLMNTFKEYFDYIMYTRCGIPSITLEGTVEDWKKLRERTLSLSRYDFEWWTDVVKPILDEFVNASSGVVYRIFWQTIYKIRYGGSGGPYITGWILALFPYLGYSPIPDTMKQNQFLQTWEKGRTIHGVTTDLFPSGAVNTPFVWKNFDKEFHMYFYAGFLGVGQDKKTLALKPVIGWAVVDKKEEEKSKMEKRQASGQFW